MWAICNSIFVSPLSSLPKTNAIGFEDFSSIESEFSYLIGDSDSDIEAGIQEHLHTVKVDNEYTLSRWCDELLSVIQ